MTNRVKSALFSIIQEVIPDSRALDLFAGSGALGLEVLSRGGREAVFVDVSEEAVDCIRRNLAKTELTDYARVIQTDANNALQNPAQFDIQNHSFDIIFISPPHADVTENLIEGSEKLLKKGGIIIAEYPLGTELSEAIGGMKRIDSRQYGKTGFDIFKQ